MALLFDLLARANEVAHFHRLRCCLSSASSLSLLLLVRAAAAAPGLAVFGFGLRFLCFRLLPCFGFLLLDVRVWKPSRPGAARRFTRVRRPALVLRVSCATSVRDLSSFRMLLGLQKLGAGWEVGWGCV